MTPKVSIIVPIYNVEKYLTRCMESILNQTLKDIEIILVDDGSPDSCPEICDEYARQDNRVKVKHKKNEGLGFARNSGLEIATGEYVVFVDSDDFVKTTMLEELYNEARLKKLDILFCNYYERNNEGNIKEVREVKLPEYYTGQEDIFRFLLNMIGAEPAFRQDRKYSMSVWHGIYLNEIIQQNKITFPSERELISEDIFFQIKFLYKSKSIGYSSTCNYFYCENETSLTKSYRNDRFEKYKILHNELKNMLYEMYPNKIKKITLSVDRLLLGYVRSLILFPQTKVNEIRVIFNDAYIGKIIYEYPYNKLPLKYRFFVLLMKYKLLFFILILKRKIRQ
ncbi:MAG: glycosyltransferase [Bacteroidia bacterium]